MLRPALPGGGAPTRVPSVQVLAVLLAAGSVPRQAAVITRQSAAVTALQSAGTEAAITLQLAGPTGVAATRLPAVATTLPLGAVITLRSVAGTTLPSAAVTMAPSAVAAAFMAA